MSPLLSAGKKLLIGVVHLQPLPGAPGWRGDLGSVVNLAVADARAWELGGADALIIENFGDAPFAKSGVGPETVAAMAVVGRTVRQAVKLPLGFNVLRNDARAALALCATCAGSFIRVNVHSGAMLTDQGLIEGNAFETVRYRQLICPGVLIFADVHVKHAVPLGEVAIEDSARDTVERGLADALIVSGPGTGRPADIAEVRRVRQACASSKILIGSGVTAQNVQQFLRFADGVIVGTWAKVGGKVGNAVDAGRVAALARAMKQ